MHVAGINSALGREIAYQACIENKFGNIDYVSGMGSNKSKNQLMVPYRGGGLVEEPTNEYFRGPTLKLFQYDQYKKVNELNYDALILTMGGSAFEMNDYSDTVTKNILKTMPSSCKNIICVSAFGVTHDWKDQCKPGIPGFFEGIGIQSMKDLYLREVYRAKKQQELLLNKVDKAQVIILRPKVLSYDTEMRNNTKICHNKSEPISRFQLAQDILGFIKP